MFIQLVAMQELNENNFKLRKKINQLIRPPNE